MSTEKRFEKIKSLIGSDGTKFGQPVKGGRFVRNFCWNCLEPIRCTFSELVRPCYCEECQEENPEEINRQTLSREIPFDLDKTSFHDTGSDNGYERNPYEGYRICKDEYDLNRDI